MAEKLTVSAIDNDVLAQVILGDTLRTVYFKSGSIVAAVADYFQGAISVFERNDEEAATIMDGLMRQYLGSDEDGIVRTMGILATSGLTISCNSGGVREKMIALMKEFKGKNPNEQTAWIVEVLTGERLSSDSFPPMPTALAI